jgi:DICT domain-containing protein
MFKNFCRATALEFLHPPLVLPEPMLIIQKHFRQREDDAYPSSITKLTRTQLSITGVRERETPYLQRGQSQLSMNEHISQKSVP